MGKIVFLGVMLGMLLIGCQQPVKIEMQPGKLSNTSDRWNITVERTLFSSADANAETSCKVINSRISALLDSLQQNIKVQADTFYALYEGKDERPIGPFELYITDSVFMATGKFISLRLLVYEFTGGAHGMTNFYAFNYDMQNGKFLNPDEIIDYKQADLINKGLAKNFINRDSCFSDIPTLINGFTALNVSPEAVCFTYPQYSLGAYACGVAQVSVPDPELKGILKVQL